MVVHLDEPHYYFAQLRSRRRGYWPCRSNHYLWHRADLECGHYYDSDCYKRRHTDLVMPGFAGEVHARIVPQVQVIQWLAERGIGIRVHYFALLQLCA